MLEGYSQAAGGQDGVKAIEEAEVAPSLKNAEPVGLYGVIALFLVLWTLILSFLVGAGFQYAVPIVMVAQLFFTRKAVFSPQTASKLLRARPPS